MGGVDIAERVADAGGGVQIDKAGVAGGLGVTVSHADHGGFLQAQHIIDIVGPVAQERQFRRAGIAEHLLDSECPQQIKRRIFDAHRCAGALCGFAGQWRVPLADNSKCNVRHCEKRSDEAIHAFCADDMDCFAEPVIGRARSRDPLARNDDHHVAVPFIVG